jgi:exodeoxyribonuclease VII large subunit
MNGEGILPVSIEAPSGSTSPDSLTVSALTKAIRTVLETGFADITVEGEISNFLDHRSGHRYWTLKDSEAQISCVFWKSRYLNFDLRDGMKVICRGRLTVYPPRGNYQFDVFQVRPSGIGDLQFAYEQLFAKLRDEGLFEESRKRPIPRFPQTIGIVTSENGAALQDILTVLRRRYPVANVLLRPTAVQGVGAELEIARAIQEFNLIPIASSPRPPSPFREKGELTPPLPAGRGGWGVRQLERPDVLIVGRGGGSIEDLWCFNEEAVARAIYASKIPVISAVGHEVDFTIADYVADLRAPTPTAAAELATPHRDELLGVLGGVQSGITRLTALDLKMRRREVESLGNATMLRTYLTDGIVKNRESIVRSIQRVSRSVNHGLERLQLTIERDTAKLHAMNPDRVLDRGFTALETPEGKILPRLTDLLEREEKNGILVFADGRITVRFD